MKPVRLPIGALVDADVALRVQTHSWRLSKAGYVLRHGRADDGHRITVYLHREVLGLRHGDGQSVDHINGDRLDNRRQNLRLATHAENMQNRSAHKGGSSRFRGVHWDKWHSKWRVMVRFGGRDRHVGYFADEVMAARAAEQFRREHMPFAQPDPALSALTLEEEAA